MRTLARFAAFVFVVALVGLGASPAFAANDTADRDDQVVITGSVDVRSSESVDRVLIFDGDVHVHGVVQGLGVRVRRRCHRRRSGQW